MEPHPELPIWRQGLRSAHPTPMHFHGSLGYVAAQPNSAGTSLWLGNGALDYRFCPGQDAFNRRYGPIPRTAAGFARMSFIAETTYKTLPVSGGGTFILRFAEVDNVGVLNVGWIT